MSDFNEREIAMIEQMGLLKHLLELYADVILCLTVRNGGCVAISKAEIEHCNKTYTLTKTVSTNDSEGTIKTNARLK